ncbi:MAG: response regulator [Oscillospiraceae bacterium]|jgi:DNA-binding response OmpR family regulator|nr:response regulator [Oscillospiraceae bacterium]
MSNVRHKIALVDDSMTTLNQGKILLQPSYRVYTFQSAAMLFEYLEYDLPDLILMDIEMPEMDGFETIAKLKADDRFMSIPVMFLTSKSDEESERKGFNLGAVDYITKPFSEPLLVKRISNQILYKRVREAIEDYALNAEVLGAEINKANERTKILIGKTPIDVSLWDNECKLIDCNEATVKMFGFENKQECMSRYDEIHPEYQPDGSLSIKKYKEFLTRALSDGACEFEWVYRLLDGTPLPAEVTLVRIESESGYDVAGYTKDMREHKKLVCKIKSQSNILQSMNDIAALLLTADDNINIESSLMKSMEIIGSILSIDRMHIWRREETGDGVSYVRHYRWICAVDKEKNSISQSLEFSIEAVTALTNCFAGSGYVKGQVSELIKCVRGFVTDTDVKSSLMLPMLVNGQIWGIFTIDICAENRDFTDDEIDILRSVVLMMVSILNKK